MENNFNGWSLDLEDWKRVIDTLDTLELDWNISPLRNPRKVSIPETSGIYFISGELPLELSQDYFKFQTPLYVGISAKNLRRRFISHCKGELSGVREIVRTWNPSELTFHYAKIEKTIDSRDLETLIYDLETELMYAFGPPANKRRQFTSYEDNNDLSNDE